MNFIIISVFIFNCFDVGYSCNVNFRLYEAFVFGSYIVIRLSI